MPPECKYTADFIFSPACSRCPLLQVCTSTRGEDVCLGHYRPFISVPRITLALFHTTAFSYSLPAVLFFISQRILPISPHFGPKGLGASCLGPGVRVMVNDVLINGCVWVALYLTQLKPYLAKETWGHLNLRFSKASQKREGTYLGLGGIHQPTSGHGHPCWAAAFILAAQPRWLRTGKDGKSNLKEADTTGRTRFEKKN